MGRTPLILELEQVHRCVSCETTERLRDSKIKWLATLSHDRKSVTNLFEVSTPDLPEIVERSRTLREVRQVSILQKGERKSWISIRAANSISTAPKLAKSGVMWIQPTYTIGGVDHVTLFAPSFWHYKKFLDYVEDDYYLKVKSKHYLSEEEKLNFDIFSSKGYMQLISAAELLTPRQYEIFDLACRYGYYEEPKKVSLEELGQKIEISESTAAELLRKAERKLMPILSEILRGMK